MKGCAGVVYVQRNILFANPINATEKEKKKLEISV